MNVLVLGRAKTGTTVIAKTIQNSIEHVDLLMEPKSVSKFFVNYTANVVAKVIFEHWTKRPHTRLAFIHNEFALKFDKQIAIIRDPRDELISRMFYIVYGYIKNGEVSREEIQPWINIVREKERSPGTISVRELMLVLNQVFGIQKSMKISETFDYFRFLRDAFSSAHVVRYEDFMEGRQEELERYLGFPLNREVDIGQKFSRLRRTAAFNNWKTFFLQSDLDEFRHWHGDEMESMGYGDWELTPVDTLDPEHGSGYVERICEEAYQNGINSLLKTRGS